MVVMLFNSLLEGLRLKKNQCRLIGTLRIALSDGTRFTPAVKINVACAARYSDQVAGMLLGDVKGSRGGVDAICVSAQGYAVARNTAGPHGGVPGLAPLIMWSTVQPWEGRRWVADVNNDGRDDVVEFGAPPVSPNSAVHTRTDAVTRADTPTSGATFRVLLSMGTSFAPPQIWRRPAPGECGVGTESTFIADVNADGCADMVCIGSTNCWNVALSDCKGSFGGNQSAVPWKCGGPESSSRAKSSQSSTTGPSDPFPTLPRHHSLGRGAHTERYHATESVEQGTPPCGAASTLPGTRCLIADVDGDGAADAVLFDPHTGAGTWYVAHSNKSGSFGAWGVWMSQHGQAFVHSKPIGSAVATTVFVGHPFRSNFSSSPAPVAVCAVLCAVLWMRCSRCCFISHTSAAEK